MKHTQNERVLAIRTKGIHRGSDIYRQYRIYRTLIFCALFSPLPTRYRETIGRYFKITIFLLERIYLGKLNFTQLVRLRCAFTSKETFSNERVERKKKACASYYTYASSNKQGTLSVPHLSLATILLLSVYLIGDCKDRS